MAQDAIINRWDINGDVYDIQDAGRGRPLGVATLDENGRVPYTQLPESAVEFKGYWNASTNTPTLADGTGTKGDLYYVDVAGTQDLGSGSQVFDVGDRVLYDGSVWKNMKSGGTDIEVYPTMVDLEQDLPNLEDGTIVATEEGDNFTTVDTVQSGIFNPVTSNAVAQALSWQTPTSSQALADFGFQFTAGYSGTFSISVYAKTNNLLIVGVDLTNLAGSNIGTSGTATIGICNIRPKNAVGAYGITTTAIDYTKTSAQIRMGIMTDGSFCVFESNGVTSGSNAIRGCLVIPI